jgi:hypothetical protein
MRGSGAWELQRRASSGLVEVRKRGITLGKGHGIRTVISELAKDQILSLLVE